MYELILAEIIAGICVMYGLYSLNKLILTNKLVQESSKLKSQLAKFKQDYPRIATDGSSFVADAIGDIGIEGLLQEFGIDPAIMKNPLVKGLVEKYAPRVLEKVSQPQEKNEKTGFL